METAKKQRRGISIAALIGFLVTAAAIIVIPLLLFSPAGRSAYFWTRIIWTEFLALLFWGFVGGLFYIFAPATPSPRERGGVFPTLGVITFIYVILSFTFLLLNAVLPNVKFLFTFQLPGQIILLLAYLVLGIGLYFSMAVARGGAQPLPQGVLSPAQLAALLKSEEEKLASLSSSVPLRDSIKALREKILYSLPHAGASIGESAAYASFSQDVDGFYHEVSSLDLSVDEIKSRFTDFASKADSLRLRVDVIAESIKKV